MTALARQRLWLAALCLYAAAGLADMSVHLVTEHKNRDSTGPYYLPVAFAAGLFWPADLVAQVLLAR
jgi:hypothetical protein